MERVTHTKHTRSHHIINRLDTENNKTSNYDMNYTLMVPKQSTTNKVDK